MLRARAVVAWALMVVASVRVAAGQPPDYAHERTWWGATHLADQWRRTIPRSPALDVPTPLTRDAQTQQVTLKETIAIALENNPGVAAQRLEPLRQNEGVLQAQAQYDPTLAGEMFYNRSTTPNASLLAGTKTIEVDDRSINAHLLKLFRSGTQVTLDSFNERIDNSARFNTLRPEYQPQLNFSLVQPLLRDFGWDFSYLVVRVAERTADVARYQYEAQLADFVQQVIVAYWAVVGARENVEVQRESKALADRTVEENEARVRVGLLAPVSVLEAQADAKSREEQVLIAENQYILAVQGLGQIAFFRPDGSFVPRTLEPIDEVTLEPETSEVEQARGATLSNLGPATALVERSLAVALEERPEVHASALSVESSQLTERIASNALLPRVDLVGSYGLNGLSGIARPATVTSTVVRNTPIPGTPCSPTLNGQYLCQVSVTGIAPFAGARSDAYDRLVSNDFRSYSVGVQIQVPLSNALARSQYTQSQIAVDQAELNHRQLLSQVTLEVRQSVSDVITGRQRIDTSRVARELAEENLHNQEKRHEVGIATTKDLLDFQTRLTSARAAEVQAKVDYAVAVARWRRAQGRLLSYYQIVLDQSDRHSPPWFARF
jgi:outer membrane protein TolC